MPDDPAPIYSAPRDPVPADRAPADALPGGPARPASGHSPRPDATPDPGGRGGVSTSPWPARSGALLLRDARGDDLDDLLALRNDPQVNRWMIHTHVEPADLRREWRATPTSTTDHSCVAELADEPGRLVAIGFLEITDGLGQPGMPRGTQAGIGYIVAPEHSGRGIATDLARGLVRAGFEDLGLRRITAGCNADNAASARVLEKAGMRREGHGVEASWHHERGWVDGYEYAVLAREWRAARRG